jgi:hypothetical protein
MNNLQEQLRQPYTHALWSGLLPQLLPGRIELFREAVGFPLTAENQRAIATGFRQFGRAVIPDGQGGEKILAIFEVDVAPKVDLLRNRVALRQLVARCIDEVSAHAVLAIFARPGNQSYRLTYATRESAFNTETLAVETRETATRRFTYVLGPGETRRTAAARLTGLAAKRDRATLKEVTDAFSVELLNKEFFDTYKAHYQKFCGHLLDGDASTSVFGIKLKGLDEKARDHALKPVRDFVKKLLGRLVFLHFLQKKGWLGCPANATNWKNGDANFLRQLFDGAPAADQQRFHSRRLVPLFFDTLNRQRKDDRFAITGTRVPYLNGGLFERDFDGVERIDFPAELFRDLLEFFGQYNFTIDENDPDDHEIGIDPEMLGHIFENLLEDNKDKGAFYTPKAIVQYMCQQSLIYYLKSHLGDRPEIETLVRRKDPGDPADKSNWIRQNAKRIEKLLDSVKICDPAIGSGAFPIGLLQEIYWIKLSLDWTLDHAEAKRRIIQHSIYGVDLDAGAVEIARLRFWLALIVEEDAPRPLPNLDYKIMQGDSLLESFEGIDLGNLTGKKRQAVQLLGTEQTELGLKAVSTELTVEFAEGKQAEITSLISGYFDQTDPEQKQRLHRQIDELVLGHIEFNLDLHEERIEAALDNARKELKRKQTAARGYQPTKKEAGRVAELEAQLAEVDRKRDALAELQEKPERPFFLWHLFFQDVFARGGFDIVIGNPPYLFITQLSQALKQAYFEISETADYRYDIYGIFIEMAVREQLRNGGWLCFIFPHTLLSNDSFEKLRRFLITNSFIKEVADVGPGVFVGAKNETMILIVQRDSSEDRSLPTLVRQTTARSFPAAENEFFISQKEWLRNSRASWLVGHSGVDATSLVLKKLDSTSQRLGALCTINQGLRTGDNEKYLSTSAPSKVWKPAAGGKEVQRYEPLPNGLYVYYNPAVLDAPRREEIFESKEKIVVQEIRNITLRRRLVATYDDCQFYCLQSTNVVNLRPETRKTSLKFLLAIVNSEAANFFFRQRFPGNNHIASNQLAQIPIPAASEAEQAELSALVDRILAAKRAGDEATVQQLERKIDAHVFRLFALAPEEIELIQDAQPVVSAQVNVKSALFRRVLPQLKAASPYFTTDAVARRVQELGLEISDGTLPVYLTEATTSGLIHDAGRGWYSRLSEPVPLDPKPVAKLVRAVEKAFPLLEFTVWSTAQINPWMHHLLAQPVTFLHAATDTLESVGDTLRAQGWEVAVNPPPSTGPKAVRPGEKMVVLRHAMSKQPPGENRQAPIEKILVDLIAEAPRLSLMDASEAQGVATAILDQFLVQIAVLQRYADSRAVELTEVKSINQRQTNASIGVS